MMVLGAIAVLFEQFLTERNLWVLLPGMILFMIGLMQLSSKIPSKNQDDDKNDL